MFVDSVTIKLFAGKGGDGIVAFRREKHVPKGGPSGGKGGRGGDIIMVGESGLTTLVDFQYKKHVFANDGGKAMAKDMYGRDAEDVYLKVPIGTTIINEETGAVIGDITHHNQEVIVCHGGRGGRGNAFFASARVPAPDFCEKGDPGEALLVRLDLKVLADVGLVGFPSVGKSTLISVVSRATPKIADYPFTTLIPQLGVVEVSDGRSFVMADLPGLIEGASLGAGLGIQFLKHIERTRVIVHLVDMAPLEERDPFTDYEKINAELLAFNPDILKKAQIIVASKMDMPDALENLKKFNNDYLDKYGVYPEVTPISSHTHMNLNLLLLKIADTLDIVRNNSSEDFQEEVVEYVYKPKEAPFTITLSEDGVYVVTGPVVKKHFDRTNFDNYTNTKLFAQTMRQIGVDQALRDKGVQNGDTVRIFEYEFEFTD